MIVKVENKSILDIEADIIVVNLFEGVTFPGGVTGVVDRAYNNIISDYVIGKENFEGKYGEIYQLPLVNENKKILVVGLGSSDDFCLSKIRDLTAKVVRQYNGKAKKIVSILHGAGIAGLCAKCCAQMIAEGAISGTYAFDKCGSLKSVSMPRVKTVAGYAFRDCRVLETVYLEDVTAFTANAFNYSTGSGALKSITINRVLSDGKVPTWSKYTNTSSITYAFEFYVPSQSIALYQASASYNVYNIHTLDTVMSTDDGNYSLMEFGSGWELVSFAPLGDVTTLIIPSSYEGKDIISIKPGAFVHCTTFTSITLPTTYSVYRYGAFDGMLSLQSVEVASGSTYFMSEGGVLMTANGKELVYYPAKKSGTSYTVPSGTVIVQSYAFSDATMLENVTMPASLTTIGYQAFGGLNIQTITFNSATPPYLADTDSFDTDSAGFTIYVPADSLDAYKSANGFIKYKDYIVAAS